MPTGCCKDYKYTLKQSNTQEHGTSSIVIPSFDFEIVPICFFATPSICNAVQADRVKEDFYDPPPPGVFPKIYIKNCVYRI